MGITSTYMNAIGNPRKSIKHLIIHLIQDLKPFVVFINHTYDILNTR